MYVPESNDQNEIGEKRQFSSISKLLKISKIFKNENCFTDIVLKGTHPQHTTKENKALAKKVT